MSVLRVWLRAELRTRWRSHLALLLLGAVVAAVALTAVAGARRTASAFDRYLDAQRIPQLEVQAEVDHDTLVHLADDVPHVQAAGIYAPFLAGPGHLGFVPGQDFVVFAAADQSYGRSVDRPTVLEGRMPKPDDPSEVAVGEKVRKSAHLTVGRRVRLASITPDELDALASGDTSDIKFRGPAPTVRIVGVIRTRLDLGDVSYAPNYFYATPAFYAENVDRMGLFGELLDVRLDDPASIPAFTRFVRGRVADNPEALSFGRIDEGLHGVRDATHVQALALLFIGVAAAVAGGFAIGQATARAAGGSAASHTVLRSLGVTRAGCKALTVATFFPVAVGGASLAAATSWWASKWFPTGVAGRAEVHGGVDLDLTVLAGGGALIVVGILLAAFVGARQSRAVEDRSSGGALHRFDLMAAKLPPIPATGYRWAMPRRGEGRTRTALTGVAVGVAGLVAALTFGHNLDRLVTTPSAWGWSFDADGGGGDDHAQVAARRDRALADRDVADVSVVRIVGTATIGNRAMQAFAFSPARGSIGVALVEGRQPAAADEVVLGTKSARALHVDIGDTVRARRAHGGTTVLRVVGTGTFPTIETDRFATGAAMTRTGLDQLDTSEGYEEVVFRWRPGANVGAASKRLGDALDLDASASPPADVANLRRVRSYPFVLAAFLAVVALLALAHMLVTSSRRRLSQIAVLRAIGFTRRQVRAAVSTQAGVTALVGCVVGVPLGVIIGRSVWRAVAYGVGVGESARVPAPEVLGIVGVALVVAGILGRVVALLVTRRSPALAIRGD